MLSVLAQSLQLWSLAELAFLHPMPTNRPLVPGTTHAQKEIVPREKTAFPNKEETLALF